MGDWQESGKRVKREWLAMLDGMRERTDENVKLPFVPMHVRGKSLRMVFEEVLPLILGRNPSLITVIKSGEDVIKAYAEDASSGAYEVLKRLDVGTDARDDSIREEAERHDVRAEQIKQAQTEFFDRFVEEPEDLIEALAMLASVGAAALRDGLMEFHPSLPLAELAKKFALGRETTAELLRRLLPDGRYGICLSCQRGCVALVLDVESGRWRIDEAPLSDRAVQVAADNLGVAARELIELQRCGIAFGLRLPDIRALAGGELDLEKFISARGRSWEIVTQSGLEALLRMMPSIVRLLGMEEDLQDCNINVGSVLKLVSQYAHSAVEYFKVRSARIRLCDGDDVFPLLLDPSGLKEDAEEWIEAEHRHDTLVLDISYVRSAVAVVCSDPLAKARGLVPREVMDRAAYSTAVVVLECSRPKGRLMLFGGPHEFFNRAWEGDSCAVFVSAKGKTAIFERPSLPLKIDDGGRRVRFTDDGVSVDLSFDEASARRDRHGLGRFFGEEKVVDWLPGLEIERKLLRFTSGEVEIAGKNIELAGGWMFLESGVGRILYWPLGTTWHYASWLSPEGGCGSMVHSAPMLGASTPLWWRRIIEESTDGAHALEPGSALGAQPFELAMENGPPVKVVRDCATFGEMELRYRILSAAVVPFDEDGQVLFRLRCLCGEGAGLVEIPVSLPGLGLKADACKVEFSEGGVSFRTGGREVLGVETQGLGFLSPYAPPPPGALRRLAGWFVGGGRGRGR